MPAANQGAQIGPVNPEQAYRRAHEFYSTGKHKAAAGLLQNILRQNPHHSGAMHLLGLLNHAAGRGEVAEQLLEKALEHEPQNGEFATNLTEILRAHGKVDEAISMGKRAVEISPNSSNAHSNLGIAYYDAGETDLAAACQEKALSIRPNHAQALNNLGSIRRKQGDSDAALDLYKQAINVSPRNLEAVNNLGAILVEKDQADEALKTLLPLVKARPNYTEAHLNIARAFSQKADWEKAEIAYRRVLGLDKERVEGHLGLSRVLREKSLSQLALSEAELALKGAEDSAAVYHQIAACQADLGQVEDAYASYGKALEINHEHIPSLVGRGFLKMENGDIDAAQKDFEEAISINPDDVSAHFALVRMNKVEKSSPHLKFFEDIFNQDKELPTHRAISANFAMGKCYEDLERYDEAFKHYAEGCKRKRSLVKYDKDRAALRVDRVIEYFSEDRIKWIKSGAIQSDKPIFVVGMPRSGTTLTEAIIASHPRVFGAGELPFMHGLFGGDGEKDEESYPEKFAKWSPSDFGNAAEKYLDAISELSTGADRVTDKMPANFMFLGLIHALMPNAKVIHIERDPLDTCLSCFTRLFDRSQFQSYDLEELGAFYVGYRKLMDHWARVLPKGAYYNLIYEELVADPEAQSRALIDYCDLEWDDNCLKFHEDKRRVRTASVTQVRQPIYKSSTQKWKNFEEHLQPLIRVIRDAGYMA